MKSQTFAYPPFDSSALDSLIDSQRALRKIMDSSVDVICTIDKAGQFTKVSAAAFKMWGYTPETLIGVHSMDLVYEEDASLTMNAFLQIKAGLEVTNFENRFCCKNGSIIPLVWSARWDEEEQTMYCIARDGREKRQIEQELKEKQKRLKKVQQMAKVGGWEYDLIQKQTYWVSEQLYTIYGIQQEDVPELTVEEFRKLVHPEDLERLAVVFSDTEKLDSQFIEHRIIRPNGEVAHIRQSLELVYENGLPVRLTGVVQDITALRLADQLLIANERRYRTLVQNGFDIINILDTEGNYLHLSDSIYRIMGYEPKDLVGKNAFDFIHPEDLVRMAKAFARLYTEPYVEDVEPYRFKNSKGEYRWLESKGANMLHDSAIEGLVINSRDVTDKKHMQERFERQIKAWQKKMSKASIQAQEQERAQLGRELHDNVNQVLTTVKLYTELCLDKHPDHALLLEKSATYLADCINEIRSISKRLSSPTLGEINLEDSIKELVSSLKLINKIDISLVIDCEHHKISEEVHLGVYRIIQEHMTNVLKHAQAQNVDIHISVNQTHVSVIIKDNGIGFNLKDQRKGIGINNMHGRAESLNGMLSINSKPAQGCTLYLSLPLEEASTIF